MTPALPNVETVRFPGRLPSGGVILTSGAPGWDEARRAWHLAVDQHPAAVALPHSAADVAAVVGFARQQGWRVTAQGTGHNAAPLGSLADTILVKTERMREVQIDPVRRVARVGAGVVWLEVVHAAAEHGLAALAGSGPDIGVVGYTLGGGLSWLGRRHGLAANKVEAVELVTADGWLRRVDRDHDPHLFWALRGGGGNFGVVTALEFRLFEIRQVRAGILWWPIDRGPDVLHTWRELTGTGLPDDLTTVGRYLQLPPSPEIPEPVRGQSWIVVEVIHFGPAAEAGALLAPLRALSPVLDTVQTIPMRELSHLHMDPEQPVSAIGDGLLLADLPAQAIDQLTQVAGAEAGSPLLSVELRHLGGALGRAQPEHGAIAAIDAAYALFAIGSTPTPAAAAAVASHVEVVKAAMAPWSARHMYLNFAETSRDPATLWTEQAYHRLRRIKADVDPHDLIRANHPIPPSHH